MFQWLRRRQRPCDEKLAAMYMSQLLSALSYLHSMGVAHRDLKLSNLLLSKNDSVVKICDFGLACETLDCDGSSVEHRTLCGTPNYIGTHLQLHYLYKTNF